LARHLLISSDNGMDEIEILYGDSTPFPYGVDFIEMVRAAIACGVDLCNAQHQIDIALDRSESANEASRRDRQRLDAMVDSVRLSMTAFLGSSSHLVVNAASKILESTQAFIELERVTLSERQNAHGASTESTVDEARVAAYRAIAAFLLRHDLPETRLGLHLLAGNESYGAQSQVLTPFGIEGRFALAIPIEHAWGRPRRVGQLATNIRVELPEQVGWLAKRTLLQSTRLDSLFVSEVVVGAGRTMLGLRKAPRGGGGVRLDIIDGPESRVTALRLDEAGQPLNASAPDDVHGEGRANVLRLSARVVETVCDLALKREEMTSATFNHQPLRDHDQPREVCRNLVEVLAPVVREIGRRSGAPGELVLRRSIGGGRREEVYITKAELLDLVAGLPASQRSVFDPFELARGPRSPRAPISSSNSVSGEI
jgi:hypothetical protein